MNIELKSTFMITTTSFEEAAQMKKFLEEMDVSYDVEVSIEEQRDTAEAPLVRHKNGRKRRVVLTEAEVNRIYLQILSDHQKGRLKNYSAYAAEHDIHASGVGRIAHGEHPKLSPDLVRKYPPISKNR